MKIIVRQKSGLGNQLFQYAAGLYFARQYGAKLEIIKEPEKYAVSVGHPRPCLLEKFSLSAPLRERSKWDRVVCAAAMRNMLPPRTRTAFYYQPRDTAWIFQPSLPVAKTARRIYIDGPFEAHQFSEAVEKDLRKELLLREAPVGKNAEVLKQIRHSAVPVSLHVRRGDYAIENAGRDLLPMSYYHNAIAALKESFPHPTFFVFSDDIAFARENLPQTEGMVFVDHNDQGNAHEDLRLMSSCHHHIIANSTLSWWGAWLNPRRDKVVCAPELWKSTGFTSRDLLPPDWRRIPLKASSSLQSGL